jgi:hypothetical protein
VSVNDLLRVCGVSLLLTLFSYSVRHFRCHRAYRLAPALHPFPVELQESRQSRSHACGQAETQLWAICEILLSPVRRCGTLITCGWSDATASTLQHLLLPTASLRLSDDHQHDLFRRCVLDRVRLLGRFGAPVTFIPFHLLRDRTVLGANLLAAVIFFGFYMWNGMFSLSCKSCPISPSPRPRTSAMCTASARASGLSLRAS